MTSKLDFSKKQQYVKRLEEFIQDFKARDWKVDDLFAPYRSPAVEAAEELQFFETAEGYGKGTDWLALLGDTQLRFDALGIALTAWRRNKNFAALARDKVRTGCVIRLLMLHPSNETLKWDYFPDGDYESVIHAVTENLSYYSRLAKETSGIQVRALRRGIPHFSLTSVDSCAVVTQYMYSQKYGTGPLWRCRSTSPLYSKVRDEFDSLWQVGSEPEG